MISINLLRSLPSCFILLFSLCLSACNQKRAVLDEPIISFSFPDVEEAKNLIITDDKNQFFERISKLDMAIQMKLSETDTDRNEILSKYKSFLQNSVEAFSKKEKSRLINILNDINHSLDSLNIDISEKDIAIIKMNGDVYGDQAFFTREKGIYIPQGQLNMSDEALKSVIYHELFHIMSRYDSELRRQTYALIGFRPLDNPYTIPDKRHQERILLNPDGLELNYGIDLTNGSDTLLAVPIIFSKHKDYKSEVPEFFDYIEFELYEIDPTDSSIITNADLSNDIAAEYFNSFFTQISDNTQYIIHPDEILADNFMLMIRAYRSNNFDYFSESGKTIINNLHQILSEQE